MELLGGYKMQNKERNLDLIKFVVTYILVRIMFKLFNFNYDIVSNKFNASKFIIDLGSWILVWVIVSFIFKKIKNK